MGVNKCLKVCLVKPPKYRREDTTACAFLPLIFKLLYPLLSMLPYSLLLFLFCPPTVSPFPLLPFQIAYNWGEKKPNKHHLGIQNNLAFFSTLACSSNCLAPSSFCSAAPPSWCAAAVPQFQMAHLVPLKPYAAPVPRSQSLCDQPTKTMSAFPTQDPSLTPTPRPIHSRELVRQNSDPTSETPAPQAHQIREDRGPWIRLPDVELPPKVRSDDWFGIGRKCMCVLNSSPISSHR